MKIENRKMKIENRKMKIGMVASKLEFGVQASACRGGSLEAGSRPLPLAVHEGDSASSQNNQREERTEKRNQVIHLAVVF